MSLNVIQGFLRCLTARLVKVIRQDLEGSYGESPYFSTTLVLPGGGQSRDMRGRVSVFAVMADGQIGSKSCRGRSRFFQCLS